MEKNQLLNGANATRRLTSTYSKEIDMNGTLRASAHKGHRASRLRIARSVAIAKESAWNHKAVGNLSSPTKSYVYGLLQIKNPIAKDMNPMQQIQLHHRYLDHRYDGSACKAWKHFKDKGWH